MSKKQALFAAAFVLGSIGLSQKANAATCWFLSYAYNAPTSQTTAAAGLPAMPNSGLAAVEVKRSDSTKAPTWHELVMIAKLNAAKSGLIPDGGVVTPINLVPISCEKN